MTASPGRRRQPHGPLQHPDPGRVHEAPVRLASLDDLGVAGDDLHPRVLRGLGHRGDDAAEVGDREALLQDESCREVQRSGSGHGQVVDGPVHGEVTDVASGEEER
jgi:hypothetical protein